MVFDDESDLVYPNLVHCQIAASSVHPASVPAPPLPPSSSVLRRIENTAFGTSLEKYKFDVERRVLERAKERGQRTGNIVGVGVKGSEGSVEVSLGSSGGSRTSQVLD